MQRQVREQIEGGVPKMLHLQLDDEHLLWDVRYQKIKTRFVHQHHRH
ncbi:hypothetical protein [Nodularia sp. UHCC 0506]|nr:hypothetical protein [Nodularia sp. UHCC 0506]MEA5517120.1 hypothetical protein [Nodularia sp. UHCC 0506]